MRRRHHTQVDEASLQTDVMRFMAIVAFCLIAILAMVRNVEAPPAPADTVSESTPAPVVAEATPDPEPPEPLPAPLPPEPAPRPSPEIAEPEERVFVIHRDPVFPEVVETRRAAPQPEIEVPPEVDAVEEEVAEEQVAEEQVAVEETLEVVAAVEPPPTPAPEPKAEPVAEAEAEAEEGLTLRFASEADFLRLVARGKVAVYAFDDNRFLTLAPDYQFAPAPPPQQVYELDPGTIPSQMRSALARVDGPAPTKWAVGLPSRVQRQIQDLVATVDNGELLINRFEEVRHVAAR